MKANEVKKVLLDKNVTALFHANTTLTSLTFLNNGGLMSRGVVDDKGLAQTKQFSDASDKKNNVYYDIFFDSVDIHKRAKQLNKYGEVMFVYSVDVLDELIGYDICVTKMNPMYWKSDMILEDKYFTNDVSLHKFFYKGDFSQHITIKNMYQPLSFDYLEKIIIDYPGKILENDYKKSYEAISNALKTNKIIVPFETRNCTDECKCKEQYEQDKEKCIYYKKFRIR